MGNQAKVLVVDDEQGVRDFFSHLLIRLGYIPSMCASGEQAITAVRNTPPDVVLLDCAMPDMDGLQTLRALQEDPRTMNIPVIMMSGIDAEDSIHQCIEGGAEDYLLKPINIDMIKARLYSCMRRKRRFDQQFDLHSRLLALNSTLDSRLREQIEEMSRAQIATIFALSRLAESRDPETGHHLERMREYCRALLLALRSIPKYTMQVTNDFIDATYEACPLHDIGKVGIPDHVLLKPGRLTPEEHDIIKTHTTIGAETLRRVDRQYPGNNFLKIGIQIAQSHHERWDGAGYPQGLSGEAIPLAARVLAIGDVYDALTSRRCYKEAFSHEDSVRIIEEGRGSAFDPELVDIFLSIKDNFQNIRNLWNQD